MTDANHPHNITSPTAEPKPIRPSVPATWAARTVRQRVSGWIRRLVVMVLGLSVLAVGIVMIVTPGPALLVIPAGLGILATEFSWAARLLNWLRERIAVRLRPGDGPNQPDQSKSPRSHSGAPNSAAWLPASSPSAAGGHPDSAGGAIPGDAASAPDQSST